MITAIINLTRDFGASFSVLRKEFPMPMNDHDKCYGTFRVRFLARSVWAAAHKWDGCVSGH